MKEYLKLFLIFLKKKTNRYTGKEVIAKGTVVAKLRCHDLDEPPDTIHYASVSGPLGSGQIFEQVPNADNFIQVSTRSGHCRGGGALPQRWSNFVAIKSSARGALTQESVILGFCAISDGRHLDKSFMIVHSILSVMSSKPCATY